jgi:hypothetical protein
MKSGSLSLLEPSSLPRLVRGLFYLLLLICCVEIVQHVSYEREHTIPVRSNRKLGGKKKTQPQGLASISASTRHLTFGKKCRELYAVISGSSLDDATGESTIRDASDIRIH